MKKILSVVASIFVLAITVSTSYYFAIFLPNKQKVSGGQEIDLTLDSVLLSTTPASTDILVPEQVFLGVHVVLETPEEPLDILFREREIHFEFFEDWQDVYESFTIKQEDYPGLFKQGIAEYSWLRAELVNEGAWVKLSNNQPSHGAYDETYYLVVDPKKGEVVEVGEAL